eukprot:6454898-Amphidinium_carterae.1
MQPHAQREGESESGGLATNIEEKTFATTGRLGNNVLYVSLFRRVAQTLLVFVLKGDYRPGKLHHTNK